MARGKRLEQSVFFNSDKDRTEFLELARAKAITDSCKDSLDSVKSGIRCYMDFAEKVLKKKVGRLPPSVDELLAWSAMFRSVASCTDSNMDLKSLWRSPDLPGVRAPSRITADI